MDTLASQLRTEGWGSAVQPLTICLVSEDVFTASRAEAFLKALLARVPPGLNISKRTWTLNELRLPRSRGIAAADAGSAECVVLSLHHTAELPAHATEWLSAIARTRKRKGGTLVGLLDFSCDAEASAVRDALQHAAKNAGMRLLLHVGLPVEPGE